MRTFHVATINRCIGEVVRELPNTAFKNVPALPDKAVAMRDHMDELLHNQGDRLLSLLDEFRILSIHLTADYFSRKLKQAAVIEFFAPELAFEYLSNGNPNSSVCGLPFATASAVIREATAHNDRLFEELAIL